MVTKMDLRRVLLCAYQHRASKLIVIVDDLVVVDPRTVRCECFVTAFLALERTFKSVLRVLMPDILLTRGESLPTLTGVRTVATVNNFKVSPQRVLVVEYFGAVLALDFR